MHFPSRALSTDNAVMIAAAAFPKFRRGEFAGLGTAAEPALAEDVDLEAVLGGGIRKAPAAVAALLEEAEAASGGL